MTGYPLVLDLTGLRVLVVGGGRVAAEAAEACWRAGADVLVVAPIVNDVLTALAGDGSVRVLARCWQLGDLDDAWLVHAATGDESVDDAVASCARSRRVWCVRAGRPASAVVPAVVRSGGVLIAVTTDRGAPDVPDARSVRDAIALGLDCGRFPVRRRRAGAGSVSLVGGGPGDPGLLTVRGRRLLAEADVVVVDRLGPRAVLAELDPDVLVVDVGKSPDRHPVPQEEINRLLVMHARAGRRVVRLKGGDPYVLGRGGEELAYCRAEGVDVAVVPGVTSAFAVPAAAGIPVTHRGLSRQVTVLSGHEDADWEALAGSGGTLVFLMGVAALPSIVAGLLQHGMDPTTPVAVVERGWLPDQRTTAAPLGRIREVAQGRSPRNPAVIVVGAVAALCSEWGEQCPPAPDARVQGWVPVMPATCPEVLVRAAG